MLFEGNDDFFFEIQVWRFGIWAVCFILNRQLSYSTEALANNACVPRTHMKRKQGKFLLDKRGRKVVLVQVKILLHYCFNCTP